MKRLFLVISLCFVLCQYLKETDADGMHEGIEDPDIYRNVSEIISSKGYPVEEHTVQTDDGYLLSVVRIPHGRKHLNGHDKGAVLLIHGLLCDANSWVLNFPGQSLGFILPDEGYDVWMISTRGTGYSKKHVTLNSNERQFWNFSMHEVGHYDIPATIDYILKVTGKEAIYIIGHSQGTAATFLMLSDKPDYNEKVKLFIALAPVTFLGHSTSSIPLIFPFKRTFLYLNDLFTKGEFVLDKQFIKKRKSQFCSTSNFNLCEIILIAIGGGGEAQLNQSRMDVYASHLFTSTSSKSFLHYGQMFESKTFRKYDYGRHFNLEYYQQEEPPDYETSRITTPVAFFWSRNDTLNNPEDVHMLRKKLNSLIFDYEVPYQYGHFDFLLAENAAQLVYQPILKLLSTFI